MDWILQQIYQVAKYLASIMDWLLASVVSLIKETATWVKSFFEYLTAYLKQLFGDIYKMIQTVLVEVVKVIQGYITSALAALQKLIDSIVAFIGNVVLKVEKLVTGAWAYITQTFETLTARTTAILSAITSRLVYEIEASYRYVREWVSGMISQMKSLFERTAAEVGKLALSVVDYVKTGLRSLIDPVVTLVQGGIRDISAGWQKLLGAGDSMLSTLATRLGDVKVGMADIAETLADSLGALTKEQVKYLREASETLTKLLGGLASPENRERTSQALAPTVETMLQAGNVRTLVDRARGILDALPTPLAMIVVGALYVSITLQAFGGVTSDVAEVIAQEWRSAHPSAILAPSDVVAAWRRGMLARADAVGVLRKHGLSDADGERILTSAENAPTPWESVSMWRRGIITRPQLSAAIKQAGLGEEWEAAFVELTEYIPPVPDLIHMAVREAFSPDVAQAFGQYEDFPESILPLTRAQGLADEHTRRYWAAHWALPSATQGFEMLHRGAIDRQRLEMLLRALDVMPAWREPLTQIAYNVYHRVDIRRMHKLGILSDADLPKAHRDLGYDDEHAEALSRFVQQLNRPKSAEEATELGKLSRSAILGFYRDGVLTRQSADKLLVEGGLTADAAGLFLDDADADRHRVERQEEASLAVELALAGQLNAAQMRSRLQALGLTATEIARATTQLYRAQVKRVRLPSRADGERFYRSKLIDRNAYGQLLELLGYPVQWVEVYLAAVDRGIETASEPV